MSYPSSEFLHYFNEGSATRLYETLGSHLGEVNGEAGTHFCVWAPSARSVKVIGDFCYWSDDGHPMSSLGSSGIWHVFVPGLGLGTLYKYRIETQDGAFIDKADPVAFGHEVAPKTASIVTTLEYEWHDESWMKERGAKNALSAPISVYELHLGSWRRGADNQMLGYRDIAPMLVEYVKKMGFTHVELMPLCEHPFYGSWGYQVTGYFAATSRYGSPQDLMFLIDSLHQAGIGVIIDWVPAHFPTDAHGLGDFDGSHLYEHADARKGFHPDWNTYIFNYDRHEVRSFLISSAIYWLDRFHVDALRVDGVASMLYLDYSRSEGEWIPNEHGGRENLGAIQLLRDMNTAVYREFPDIQTIAEESTAFPGVTTPVDMGGLGFGLKWDMGWMHDTLEYFGRDPIYRKHHQEELTKRALWAYTENYCLPLSHDEVVHGKGSLIARMPGDDWQRFANMRLLLGYMFATPGKKLLFMGSELAQSDEWKHDYSIHWDHERHSPHRGVQELTAELNHLYSSQPALYALDVEPSGHDWLHIGDSDNSILAFERRSGSGEAMFIVCNFTPSSHRGYRIGVNRPGRYELLLDTDDARFGGSDFLRQRELQSETEPFHGREHSVVVDIAPLSVSFWKLN